LSDKSQFKTEVDSLYKDAIVKYSADVKNEELTDVEVEVSDEEERDIPF
jgi:hypothetical protein